MQKRLELVITKVMLSGINVNRSALRKRCNLYRRFWVTKREKLKSCVRNTRMLGFIGTKYIL